jgi:hypothetical protein
MIHPKEITMPSVTRRETQTHTPELLEELQPGEGLTITDHIRIRRYFSSPLQANCIVATSGPLVDA